MMKTTLHRTAIWLERALDPLIPVAPNKPPVIDAYLGYATPTRLILRGRVLIGLRRTQPDPRHGWFTNLRQMLSLFFTNEVAGVPVRAVTFNRTVVTDEEGYFTLDVPRSELDPGWHAIPLTIPGVDSSDTLADVLVNNSAADYGVISDIDDTMMETGAYSILRNLWTSLTGSALTRKVFPDAVELIERLHDDHNPVYYVSSSPWNLHAFLETVLFKRAGLVRGPLFLRDLGVSETQFISGTHGDHKGLQIDRLFEAHPGLGFVLIGDSGQHDAEVYRDAAARWPGRVRRVLMRDADPTPAPEVAAALDDLRAMGIPVWRGRDYTPLLTEEAIDIRK
ncbi:App1 family protein [Roseobacter sp. HKCCA0434]|uniref:App1 family protein n=1 Tax=Roseobacter sp. HKCCA0434 TaxID=3079297 RepID=UPI002905D53B|nr:phosphatase domain-containing protein [Roseobacter sp. HKCCA0434]